MERDVVVLGATFVRKESWSRVTGAFWMDGLGPFWILDDKRRAWN